MHVSYKGTLVREQLVAALPCSGVLSVLCMKCEMAHILASDDTNFHRLLNRD